MIMRRLICVTSLLLWSACSGGGSGTNGDASVTPDAVDFETAAEVLADTAMLEVAMDTSLHVDTLELATSAEVATDLGPCGDCPKEGQVSCLEAGKYRLCLEDEDGCLNWQEPEACPEQHECVCWGAPEPVCFPENGVSCICMPDCTDKQCGSNGCEGTCGECEDLLVCQEGACVCEFASCGEACCAVDEVCSGLECCLPDCESKTCGDDGCGGVCGECADGFECQEGQCACIPQCDGLDCGDDGCGSQCGQCSELGECVDGLCVCPFAPCEGTCCLEGQVCNNGHCCTPDCDNLDCGPDGCAGSCGSCGPGWGCIAGLCVEGENPACQQCQQSCQGTYGSCMGACSGAFSGCGGSCSSQMSACMQGCGGNQGCQSMCQGQYSGCMSSCSAQKSGCDNNCSSIISQCINGCPC